MFHLKAKKLHPDARLPEVAHPGDLGCDIFSLDKVSLPPGGQALLHTGIVLRFPDGWGGIVKDRSSMALAGIYTSGGVIDAGYRGELKIILRNGSGANYEINRGDKIAQIIPLRAEQWVVEEAIDLDETKRATGGFGSTGTR